MEFEKACVEKLVELRKVKLSCIVMEVGRDFIRGVIGGMINTSFDVKQGKNRLCFCGKRSYMNCMKSGCALNNIACIQPRSIHLSLGHRI